MRNKTNVDYVKTKYVVDGKKTKCFLTYEIDLSKWPVFGFKINSDVILKAAMKSNMEYYDVDRETNYPTKIGFVVTATASCDNIDTFEHHTPSHLTLAHAQHFNTFNQIIAKPMVELTFYFFQLCSALLRK